MYWHILTPFGNATQVWPVVVFILILFSWRDKPTFRAGMKWAEALGGASVLVAASKVSFYGWGTGVRDWNLTCFSGHAVLATGFWPVLASLFISTSWRRTRFLSISVGWLLGGLVAVSRVAIHAHPPSEALAGFLLGAGVAWFGLCSLRGAYLSLHREALGVIALLGLIWWGGANLNRAQPNESWFSQVAITLSGRDKPYTRWHWLREKQI